VNRAVLPGLLGIAAIRVGYGALQLLGLPELPIVVTIVGLQLGKARAKTIIADASADWGTLEAIARGTH
jgi:hypothetical protein